APAPPDSPPPPTPPARCVPAGDAGGALAPLAPPRLATLTLTLPADHLLRVEVEGGRAVRDADARAWRRARAAKRPSAAPDVIFPQEPSFRLLGFYVRTGASELSALGVRGATVRSAATRAEGAVEALARLAAPSLVAVWLGTNSAARPQLDLEEYERHYTALVRALRAEAPEAGCLLIAPPDFGRRPSDCLMSAAELRVARGKRKGARELRFLAQRRAARVCDPDALLHRRRRGRLRYPVPGVTDERGWQRHKDRCAFRAPPLLSPIVEAQRRVAAREGCAFYDTLAAMGGEGAMWRWACARPRWAQLDLVHLSAQGYAALGAHVAQSLTAALSGAPPPAPLSPPPPEVP
ncbi:MAG: hypothetical protein FJ138_09190, partial [Deltaproteobacteria bacterium]|nr:hypothetical protein [Deltaproteobacteria bacterium]